MMGLSVNKESNNDITIHEGGGTSWRLRYTVPAARKGEDWLTHLARKPWATLGMLEELHAAGVGGDEGEAGEVWARHHLSGPVGHYDRWNASPTGSRVPHFWQQAMADVADTATAAGFMARDIEEALDAKATVADVVALTDMIMRQRERILRLAEDGAES
jgi:hypothetical protein